MTELSDRRCLTTGMLLFSLILSLLPALAGCSSGSGLTGVLDRKQAVSVTARPVAATKLPAPGLNEQAGVKTQPRNFPAVAPDKAVPEAMSLPAGPLPGDVLRSVPAAGKCIALTFDDGPTPLTQEYLKALREAGVHSTFFILGCQVKRYPGLVAKIAADGHEIANHSYSHSNYKRLTLTQAEQDLIYDNSLIAGEVPVRISYFRPPGGNINAAEVRMAEQHGLRTVLWSIDPRDWEPGSTPGRIVSKVLTGLKPGAIVVLHDGKKQTLAALPVLIRRLKEEGWQLVTVSQLLAGAGVSAAQTEPQQEEPVVSNQDRTAAASTGKELSETGEAASAQTGTSQDRNEANEITSTPDEEEHAPVSDGSEEEQPPGPAAAAP